MAARIYTILVVGPPGVGKDALVQQLASMRYIATSGGKFRFKPCQLPLAAEVHPDAVIGMWSKVEPVTAAVVQQQLRELNLSVPTLLVGNKADLPHQALGLLFNKYPSFDISVAQCYGLQWPLLRLARQVLGAEGLMLT